MICGLSQASRAAPGRLKAGEHKASNYLASDISMPLNVDKRSMDLIPLYHPARRRKELTHTVSIQWMSHSINILIFQGPSTMYSDKKREDQNRLISVSLRSLTRTCWLLRLQFHSLDSCLRRILGVRGNCNKNGMLGDGVTRKFFQRKILRMNHPNQSESTPLARLLLFILGLPSRFSHFSTDALHAHRRVQVNNFPKDDNEKHIHDDVYGAWCARGRLTRLCVLFFCWSED